MRPLIGVTPNHDQDRGHSTVSLNYTRAVERAGGSPVVLPITTDPDVLAAQLARLDGLLLTGGPDYDPVHYGEDPGPRLGAIAPERDAMELALARLALARGMPVLGICRGVQGLCVAAGGSLYQDLPSQVAGAIKHSQDAPRWYATHGVRLVPGTRVRAIHGVDELRVNSFHHQAVREPPPGFVVSAAAPDGVIEAIEDPSRPFVLGVQWHPEGMWERDPAFLALFRALVAACRGT